LLPLIDTRAGRRMFPPMRALADASNPSALADDAIDAIDGMKRGPFFLTVFFSAPRAPYSAPAPYYGRFTQRAYRGRYKYDKPIPPPSATPRDPADVAHVRGLYDGAVASVDDAAARILRALERRGLDRNTIVVITSDHGETLFEGGHGQGHGDHLFGDEATHI